MLTVEPNHNEDEAPKDIERTSFLRRRVVSTEFGDALSELRRRYRFRNRDLEGGDFTAKQVTWLSRLSSRLSHFDLVSFELVENLIQEISGAIVLTQRSQGRDLPQSTTERIQEQLLVAAKSDFKDAQDSPDALILAKELSRRTGRSIAELAFLSEDNSLSNQALFDKWLGEKA